MIAGRYTLEHEVGRGGMGAVWLGRDEVLGRAVALKQIGMAPGGSQPDLTRAAREARLAARLNHPHVVAVFDLVSDDGDGDGRQWLVMEYVESLTLAQMVRDRGPLPVEDVSSLLVQAADALAAAHAAGIVHRDVKPSNILVTAEGQVKLSDFGIARAEADASLTQTGLVTGSPAYLAPEVASGRPATDASDVWSLGATLFHALAGRPPYEVGDNVLGALYRIVHEEPPRLPDAGRLATLLEVTMATDPAQRWPMTKVRDYLADTARASPVPTPRRTAASAPAPRGPAPGDPGELRTEVLPVSPATSATSATGPGRASASSVAPPHPPVEGSSHHGRRRGPARGWLATVAVVLLVALIAALAWLAFGRQDADTNGASPAGGHSPGASGPSDTTSHGSDDGSSDGSSTGAGPTAEGMRDFIASYLSTVTRDPAAAYRMLTPAFQRASGGLSGYRGFWGTIRSAELASVESVDPGSGTIRYRVVYTRKNGSTTTDDVSLQLDYRDGEYLIAGES